MGGIPGIDAAIMADLQFYGGLLMLLALCVAVAVAAVVGAREKREGER